MNKTAILLRNISKTYVIREKSYDTIRDKVFNFLRPKGAIRKIEALENINLRIFKGETVGIIGHNGSGKSTLMNLIMGSIKPDKGGTIFKDGSIMKLSLGMGFDPNLSARDNIFVNASVMGLTNKEIKEKFDSIIDFSGLHDFIETPVKYFSKGMKSRLTFATAMNADADIFLFDEFFGGVGDIEFRQKSDEKFKEKIVENKTIVIVSHSPKIIKNYCTRAIWIHKGKIKKKGDPEELIDKYKKFYARQKKMVNKS